MSSDNTQDQVTEAFRDAGALESGGSGSTSSTNSTQEDVTDAFEEEGLLGGDDGDGGDGTGGGGDEETAADSGGSETDATDQDSNDAVDDAERAAGGVAEAIEAGADVVQDAADSLTGAREPATEQDVAAERTREGVETLRDTGTTSAESDTIAGIRSLRRTGTPSGQQRDTGRRQDRDPEPQQGDIVTRGARDLVEGATGTDLPTERELVRGLRQETGEALGVDVPSQAEATVESRQQVEQTTGVDLPSEPELSRQSRQAVGETVGQDIPSQQAGTERLQQEVSETTGVDVPDEVDPRSAAALAPAAVAEPTPLGEAAVGGIALGAGIVQSGERLTTRASERVGRQDESELDVPEDPQGQRREIDVSDQQQVTAPELGLPEGALDGQTELSVPDDVGREDGELQIPEERDRLVVQTQQSLQRGRQQPRERERSDDDAITVPEELLPDDDVTLGEPEPEITEESPGRQERRREASEREVLISPGSPGEAESVSEVDPQGEATEPQVQLTQGPDRGQTEVTPLGETDTVQGSDVVTEQRPDVEIGETQRPRAEQRTRQQPAQLEVPRIDLEVPELQRPTAEETGTTPRFETPSPTANPTVDPTENPPENPPQNPPAEATATTPAQPARATQRFDPEADDNEEELPPLGLGFDREVEFTLEQQEIEFQQPGDGV